MFSPSIYQERMIKLKEYNISVELTLKTKFKQSSKNGKEIKEKVSQLIIDSIKEKNKLMTLFKDESIILIFDISNND